MDLTLRTTTSDSSPGIQVPWQSLFWGCLAGTLVFRASWYVGLATELFLWPLYPASWLESRFASWLLRGGPVAGIAAALSIAGLVIPTIRAGRARLRTISAASLTSSPAPTVGELVLLVYTMQVIVPIAAIAGSVDSALLAAFVAWTALAGALVARPQLFWARPDMSRPAHSILTCVVVGSLIGAADFAVSGFLHGARQTTAVDVRSWHDAITLLFLSPFIFELIYRGGVQRALTPSLGTFRAVLATTVLYVFAHAGSTTPLRFLDLAFFSLAAGVSYAKTNSLVTPLTAHVASNLALLLSESM